METAIIKRDPQEVISSYELTPEEVVAQVQKVQQIMRLVMKDGEHFGKIPGCGPKPTLLKPGAEKLSFTFRLAPKFFGEREPEDLGNGHLQYVIRCELYHVQTGMFMGSGLGSCSTLEAKYRWRTGPKTATGKPVPREYWDLRNSDPVKALALLGGKGFTVGKNDAGVWEIFEAGERIEHDNPADYYNTVLKIAKKRAHVDAVLTATAASDIFTQDLEDIDGTQTSAPLQPVETPERKSPKMPERKSASSSAPGPPRQVATEGKPATGLADAVISEPRLKRWFGIWRGAGIPEDIVKNKLKEYGYDHHNQIRVADYETLCIWAADFGRDQVTERSDYDDSPY